MKEATSSSVKMCESTDVDPSLQSSWRLLWEKKTAGKWWGDRKIWGVCEGFCLTCFAAIEIPNSMVGNPWRVAGDSKNRTFGACDSCGTV